MNYVDKVSESLYLNKYLTNKVNNTDVVIMDADSVGEDVFVVMATNKNPKSTISADEKIQYVVVGYNEYLDEPAFHIASGEFSDYNSAKKYFDSKRTSK